MKYRSVLQKEWDWPQPLPVEIIIDFEPGDDISLFFNLFARHSYQLANPRYFQTQHKLLYDVDREVELDTYFSRDNLGLSRLCIDYINDRDCRTVVNRLQPAQRLIPELVDNALLENVVAANDDWETQQWSFNAYAFMQRGVDFPEFRNGDITVNPAHFVDEVMWLYAFAKVKQ